MSTGAKNAKRAITIDAFFAPKQQKKDTRDVATARQDVTTTCTRVDSASGDIMTDSLDPRLQQQPCEGAVAAASADEAATAKVTPRISGRKRRNPGGSSAKEGEGAAAVSVEDATAAPALVDGAGPRSATDGSAVQQVVQQPAVKDNDVDDGDLPGPVPSTLKQEQGQEQGQRQQEQEGQGSGQQQQQDAAGLTPAQLAQVAANRNRALARRAVVEASTPGAPPLQLSALLVEPTWKEALRDQFTGDRAPLKALESFLHGEWRSGRKPVFPPQECIFQAFNACPMDQVRVVILGQDPYHGPGQAMGLSFSVPRDVRPLPPSLVNIYKEAAADLGWQDRPQHGDLSAWSVQGVLLLNTCLTVRQGEANSHAKRGWEAFTDAAIRALSARSTGVLFLLWGNPAQTKAGLVDTRKHHVLKAAHPSPLSASRGFFGCRHFSKANQLLSAQGLPPIDWRPT